LEFRTQSFFIQFQTRPQFLQSPVKIGLKRSLDPRLQENAGERSRNRESGGQKACGNPV
jgi:hypothetical protein